MTEDYHHPSLRYLPRLAAAAAPRESWLFSDWYRPWLMTFSWRGRRCCRRGRWSWLPWCGAPRRPSPARPTPCPAPAAGPPRTRPELWRIVQIISKNIWLSEKYSYYTIHVLLLGVLLLAEMLGPNNLIVVCSLSLNVVKLWIFVKRSWFDDVLPPKLTFLLRLVTNQLMQSYARRFARPPSEMWNLDMMWTPDATH